MRLGQAEGQSKERKRIKYSREVFNGVLERMNAMYTRDLVLILHYTRGGRETRVHVDDKGEDRITGANNPPRSWDRAS